MISDFVREEQFQQIKAYVSKLDARAGKLLAFASSVKFVDNKPGFSTASIVKITRKEHGTKAVYAFLFSKQFWDLLNDTERVFLVLHECYHGLLFHFLRFPKFGRLEGIAIDLANNAFLLQNFTFDINDLPYLRKVGYWTDTILKDEGPLDDRLAAEQYLEILKKKYPPIIVDLSMLPGGFDQHDEQDSDLQDLMQDLISSILEETSEQTPEQLKARDEILEAFKSAGTSLKQKTIAAIETMWSNGSRWIPVARRLQKAARPELGESWVPPSRLVPILGKTSIKIPFTKLIDDRERPRANVYIDTSGSCESYIDPFAGSVRAMKKKFELRQFGFSDNVYEYKDQFFSGGTNFKDVTTHMKDNPADYWFIFTDCDFFAPTQWAPLARPRNVFFVVSSYHEQHYQKYVNGPLARTNRLRLEDFLIRPITSKYHGARN